MNEPRKILLVFLIVMAFGIVALIFERLSELVGRMWLALVAVSTVLLILALTIHYSHAQEQHGHTHDGAVGKFYQSWTMPDNRSISCCHDQDCAPSASRLINGKWQAEREGEWVPIPDNKIETERDSPDGRSHLCGKRYNVLGKGGVTVFCFIRGAGT